MQMWWAHVRLKYFFLRSRLRSIFRTGNTQMRSKVIYLDTNVWNRLMDRAVDPKVLMRDLAKKDATLALSGQIVYELARTFLSSAANASVRAQDLFRYLRPYVDARIPCAYDNMELLGGEIDAMQTGALGVLAFYGPTQYAGLRTEVEKLSLGIFDKRAEQSITGRKQFAQSTRSDIKNHFRGRGHVRDQLRAIGEIHLTAWLDKEMLSESGSAILASHLLRMYDGLTPETALRAAHRLLHIPPSRIAKGIVRADLYFNWRSANRGSTPGDLVDDVYHVLNASYCAVYATAEPKQAEYASLMLSRWTTVAIYDNHTPVDTWLLSLV